MVYLIKQSFIFDQISFFYNNLIFFYFSSVHSQLQRKPFKISWRKPRKSVFLLLHQGRRVALQRVEEGPNQLELLKPQDQQLPQPQRPLLLQKFPKNHRPKSLHQRHQVVKQQQKINQPKRKRPKRQICCLKCYGDRNILVGNDCWTVIEMLCVF